MKKFLKGFMTFALMFILSITLTGCGESKPNNEDGKKSPESGKKETTYSLTSTDNRLVFYEDEYDTYEVYYFTNNKLTKVDLAIAYQSEGLARQMYTQRGGENNKEITYIGNVFIELYGADYNSSTENLNQEQLKTYMKENNYILK